jgi:hypothetical protein
MITLFWLFAHHQRWVAMVNVGPNVPTTLQSTVVELKRVSLCYIRWTLLAVIVAKHEMFFGVSSMSPWCHCDRRGWLLIFEVQFCLPIAVFLIFSLSPIITMQAYCCSDWGPFYLSFERRLRIILAYVVPIWTSLGTFSLISPQALVRLSWFLLHSIGHQILHKDTPCKFQNYVVYWRRKQQFTFDKTPVGWMLCKKLAKTFLPNNLPFTSCMGKDITAYVRPANSMEPPQKFYLSAFFGFITLLKWPYLSFYQQWEAVNSIFGTSISKLLERALNQKCFALGVMVLPSFMFLQPYNSNWHGRQCCRSLFAFLVHRFC